MPTYTIESATQKRTDIHLEGKGEFQDITLVLVDGDEKKTASWFTKATTPLPAAGARMDFDLSWDEKFSQWKAKRVPAAGFGGPGGPGGGRPRSPEETAAIQRQHSQHMALLYVQAKAAVGAVPEDFKPDDMRPIIDWFDRDIQHGVRLALAAKTPASGQNNAS